MGLVRAQPRQVGVGRQAGHSGQAPGEKEGARALPTAPVRSEPGDWEESRYGSGGSPCRGLPAPK